ncbi:MAG TPA: DUF6069 family protein [Galbitalea sp.]|jgi:hypothetical protein|nr:DUF6069 family protein [Galbitalea sp.]
MTVQTQTSPASVSSVPKWRVVLTIAAAAIVAVAANTVVSTAAQAFGASSSFTPLSVALYGPFTAAGLVAGYVGWLVVRRRAGRPITVLRVLVPVLLLLSFVPDTVNAVVHFIPGSSLTAIFGLMIMHVIVVAVGVPVYQRLAPVS